MQASGNSSGKSRASPRPFGLDLHFELDGSPSRFADVVKNNDFELFSFFIKIRLVLRFINK